MNNIQEALKEAISERNVDDVRSIINDFQPKGELISSHIGLNFQDDWFPTGGYVEINKILCSSGKVDLNSIENGKTALTALAENCHNSTNEYARIIESFLANGADPNILDNNGWSPLAYCINKRGVAEKIIEDLIQAGSDLNLLVRSNNFMGIQERSILGMAYYNSKHFFGKVKKLGAVMTDAEIKELKERNLPLEPTIV
jgi:ankyrin repeat protein